MSTPTSVDVNEIIQSPEFRQWYQLVQPMFPFLSLDEAVISFELERYYPEVVKSFITYGEPCAFNAPIIVTVAYHYH